MGHQISTAGEIGYEGTADYHFSNQPGEEIKQFKLWAENGIGDLAQLVATELAQVKKAG